MKNAESKNTSKRDSAKKNLHKKENNHFKVWRINEKNVCAFIRKLSTSVLYRSNDDRALSPAYLKQWSVESSMYWWKFSWMSKFFGMDLSVFFVFHPKLWTLRLRTVSADSSRLIVVWTLTKDWNTWKFSVSLYICYKGGLNMIVDTDYVHLFSLNLDLFNFGSKQPTLWAWKIHVACLTEIYNV